MIAAEPPAQHVTLLQFLRALPESAWLRRSILWADDLAAIWPISDPTPFGRAEEQSRREIGYLRSAGLFQPEHIFQLNTKRQVERMLDALESFGDRPQRGPWRNGAPAVGRTPKTSRLNYDVPRYRYPDTSNFSRPNMFLHYDRPYPRRFLDGEMHDPSRFLYEDKGAPRLYRELEERSWIERDPSERGYIMPSAEGLGRMLAFGASKLHASSRGRLVPDVAEPAQARRIAAPSDGEEIRQALVLAIRGAVTPNLDTDFQRFIDFRLNERNERARRDYIEQLTSLWSVCRNGGPEHALEQVVGKVTTDLRKARESYFKRVDARTLTAQGLAASGAVIPLAATHPPAAIVGALAMAGASAVTIAVRKGAPKYVRSARASGLLATMGSI